MLEFLHVKIDGRVIYDNEIYGPGYESGTIDNQRSTADMIIVQWESGDRRYEVIGEHVFKSGRRLIEVNSLGRATI